MFRITAAALCACISTSAYGQAQCAPADAVAENLSQKYGESIVHVGFDARGVILEWWENAETGTWTLVALRPDAMRCMIAGGEMGRAVEPEPAGLRL